MPERAYSAGSSEDREERRKRREARKLSRTIEKQGRRAERMSGQEIEPEGPGVLDRVFDVLSRGQYASAGVASALLDKDPETGGFEAAWKGLQGKEKTSYRDVLEKDLGIKNRLVLGVGGFAGDVLLDPTTYIGVGLVGKAGKVGKVAKAGITAKGAQQAIRRGDDIAKLAKAEALTAGRSVKEANEAGRAARAVKFGDELRDAKAVAEKTAEAEKLGLNLKFAGKKLGTVPLDPLQKTKVWRGLAKVGERIGVDDAGQWINKAFRTSSVLPGRTKFLHNMFEGQGVHYLEESVKDLKTQARELGLKKSDREAISHALEKGDLSGLPPESRKFAEVARSLFDDWFDVEADELKLFKDASKKKPNYVYHTYRNEKKAQELGYLKRKPIGSEMPGFAERRKFKTLQEAKEKGAKPVEDILDILAIRAHKHFQVKARKGFIDAVKGEFGVEIPEIGKLGKKLKDQLKNEGFVEGKSRWAKNVYFDPEIAAVVKRTEEMLAPRSEVGGQFIKMFDRVQNKYKGLVTVPNPGFHIRNLIGDTFNGYLDGVTNPRRYTDAVNILAGKQHWKTKVGDQWLNSSDVMRMYTGNGLKSGYFRAEEGILPGAGVRSPLGGRVGDALRQGSEYREDFARLAHFVDSLKKEAPKAKNLNEAAEKAAERVQKFHFNYRDLTQFEKGVMKRVMPFYTWMRKNIPLQLEMVATRPGRVAAVPKGMAAVETVLGTHPDDREGAPGLNDLMPSWLREMATVRLRGEGEGKNALYWAPALPIEDLARYEGGAGPLSNLLSGVSPFIAGPFELAQGKMLFSGAKTPPLGEYLLNRVPLARRASEAFLEGDTGEKPPDITDKGALINYLLREAGVRQVTQGSKLGELRRQQDPLDAIIAEANKKRRERQYG